MSAQGKSVVSVVGPGRMGVGIAQALAVGGHQAQLIDVKDRDSDESGRALAEARSQVEGGLSLLAEIGFVDADGRDRAQRLVTYWDTDHADEALARSQVVFEAVPEVLAAKQSSFARIGDAVPVEALVASTTSTFGVDALAAYLREPSRFMNTHWLNPAPLMPLVEIAASETTDEEAVDTMTELLRAAGKVPVRCSSSPGFIVPRIQALAMNEAARLIEEGVADAEAIDTACRLGLGIRYATMGLIEFIDWGGVDTVLYASNYLADALGSSRHAPAQIVSDKVSAGELGMKTRRGFRDFGELDLDEYQRETLRRLVGLLGHLGHLQRPNDEQGGGT